MSTTSKILSNLCNRLRAIGANVPEVLGAKPGPLINFETHLGCYFRQPSFQLWLLVDDTWQLFTFRNLNEMTSEVIDACEALIVSWQCRNGKSYWLDVDHVCISSPTQLEHWLKSDARSDRLCITHATEDREAVYASPTHVQIGNMHFTHLPDELVDWLNAYAKANTDCAGTPWSWWWDYLPPAERQALIDAADAKRAQLAKTLDSAKVGTPRGHV